MPVRLTETTPLSEAGTAASSSGRMKVIAISSGVGSSGYYSPEVLREAADNQLIARGTPLFLDHPSETEERDRPERSVRDIAGVFTEAASYDDDLQALVGEIQVFAPYRDLLTEMAEYVGLSIRGSATDVTEGEHDGRRVPVIEGLAAIDSVDFVTRAGRGGKVLQLLESARANRRAIERGISEATVNDTREALQTALRDTYGGDSTWVYVRDFDDTTVWFDVEGEGDDNNGIFAQTYIQSADGSVQLTGDRIEVRVVTTYVPATRPDGNTTEESKEDTMGKIQIEEAEHRGLVEKAGRVDALVTENANLKAENGTLKEDLANRDRRDRAVVIITERATAAEVGFTPLECRGLLADLPVKEGALDEEAFTKTVDEAAAAKKAAGGAGQVTGFGGTPAGGGGQYVSEADFDAAFTVKGA